MLKKQKYVTAVFCLFLSFFFAAMGILQYQMIRGKKPVSTDAGIEAMNNDTVLVGGMPIGIYMETDGVMVLNTEQIAGADGKEHEPAKGIVKAGDYIMAVDHCEITGKKELLEAVGNLTGTFVVLTVCLLYTSDAADERSFGGCRKSNRNVRGVDGQTKWGDDRFENKAG